MAAHADGEKSDHPITIKNVSVTNIIGATADVNFDYEFNLAKYKKGTSNNLNDMTGVCFVVDVDTIPSIAPAKKYYAQVGAPTGSIGPTR